MRKLNRKVWPYSTLANAPEGEAADNWCKERFGYRFKGWYSYSLDQQRRLYAFKDEASLLVFKLAWDYRTSK